jgi:hypothetical protein
MTSALTRDTRQPSGHAPSTGATVFVKQLESYGVEVVFGLCGHTNIAVLDALSRSRIHFVTTRHEQGTAHMADGYARMTGKPGVVVTHPGSVPPAPGARPPPPSTPFPSLLSLGTCRPTTAAAALIKS